MNYHQLVRKRIDPSTGKPNDEEDPVGLGEMYQMLAIAFGAYCFFMREKWAAWVCLFMLYSSVINFKFDAMLTQLMTSLSLVMMAMIQVYGPRPPEGGAAP